MFDWFPPVSPLCFTNIDRHQHKNKEENEKPKYNCDKCFYEGTGEEHLRNILRWHINSVFGEQKKSRRSPANFVSIGTVDIVFLIVNVD